MDESTLSRNVARMCTRGWLRLEPGEDDRRSHQITETGKALPRKSYPAWQRAQSQVAHKLGPDGVTALKAVVKKLRS
jgi:DNA-binding MarR family transcriptional regulator